MSNPFHNSPEKIGQKKSPNFLLAIRLVFPSDSSLGPRPGVRHVRGTSKSMKFQPKAIDISVPVEAQKPRKGPQSPTTTNPGKRGEPEVFPAYSQKVLGRNGQPWFLA